MNWEKCQRSYMCKICSGERYCDGVIEDKKKNKNSKAKKNKRKSKNKL